MKARPQKVGVLVCLFVFVCVCVCACVHACMCVCGYTDVCTHTALQLTRKIVLDIIVSQEWPITAYVIFHNSYALSPGSSHEPFDQVCHLLRELHAACQDPVLLSSEYDLLVDSALLLWETARPPFARVHSHEFSICKHLLSYEMGLQVGGWYQRRISEILTTCVMVV